MTFEKLIQDISARYHLGPKGRALVEEALDLITGQPGGIRGFLEKVRDAGFGGEVDSWTGGPAPVPLSGQQMERALGADAISQIAHKVGVSQGFTRTVLGYTIPKIISQLVQGGLADLALPPAKEITPVQKEQIPPPPAEGRGFVPWLREMAIPAAALLLIFGGMGYLISAGRKGQQEAPQSAPVTAQNAPATSPKAAAPVAQNPSSEAQQAASQPETAMTQSGPAAAPLAPSMPARLIVRNENGAVAFSGTVADDATRSAIVTALQSVFGANKISGELNVDPKAGPAGWAAHLKTVLANFKVPGSEAQFEDGTVNVGGTITDASRDKIIGSVKSVLGPQFAVAALASGGPAEMAAAPSPAPATPGEKPASGSPQPSLNLPAIYFAENSARVPAGSKAALERAATLMKQLPAGSVVHIMGFSDSTGSAAGNLRMSEQRAKAVREFLVRAGVNPAMLAAEGKGAAPPAVSEQERAEGRSALQQRMREGRRVEFRIAEQ